MLRAGRLWLSGKPPPEQVVGVVGMDGGGVEGDSDSSGDSCGEGGAVIIGQSSSSSNSSAFIISELSSYETN